MLINTSTTPTRSRSITKNTDGTCPAGSHIVGFGGKTGSNAPSGSKCISDNSSAKTTTAGQKTGTNTIPGTTTTLSYILQHQLQHYNTSYNYNTSYHYNTSYTLQHQLPTTTPATTTKTVLVTKTNINNDQVTVRNDGGLTVRTLDGAVTPTADCAPQSATTVLGPSPMENGKARILAAFDPCILTSGKVLLNLPDEKGIQLVGAKIQDGQTTQSAIVPIQRIASTAPGQAQYFIDLTEQSTGLDLVSGNPVNLVVAMSMHYF